MSNIEYSIDIIIKNNKKIRYKQYIINLNKPIYYGEINFKNYYGGYLRVFCNKESI